MIITVLVISGLVAAAFLVLAIGIRGTERRNSLRNPNGDGPTGGFARRVLGVYVRQAEGHDQDQHHYCGQVRR